MYKNTPIMKDKSFLSQDMNIPFMSPLQIKIQNIISVPTEKLQRVQWWSLNDDEVISPSEELLNEGIERKLNNIDTGKEKLRQYSDVNEYLKHIDKVLNE